MVLPPNELLHLGPDPAGATWNHFDLGLGLSSHINYPQAQLGNSPPQGQPWFYSRTNPTSGRDVVVFSAPLGGATTSTNTQYARCELREYERDGTTKMAFDPKSGDHWIEGIYRIYGLSGLQKPSVCVQQAHDPDDDVIMVLTTLSSGVTKLVLRFNGTQVAVLNSNYADGTEFYLKTRVNNGTPEVYYTTNLASIPSTPTYTSSGFFSGAATGWYYKTGSYNQTNESTDPNVDADASIIRVEARELKHWHSTTPKGGAWPTPATYAAAGSPTVNAGADASVTVGSAFTRTGTVTLNGATLTSQQWSILSGPTGVGSTLSTASAVSWTPTTAGTYTLEFRAVTSAGTFTDTVVVTVSSVSVPVDTNTAAGRLAWGTPVAVDEFNYTGAPSSTNWSVYDGPGHDGMGIRAPARVAVDGTKMTITGLSGSANTGGISHKFDQKYGKWEVRARSQSTGTGGGTTGFTAQVFVSPTGSDSNSGLSASSPKKTIAAAISAASAGQTISVADGTYTGNVVTTKGGSSTGGYITIRAANKWAAIISGNDSTSDEAGISVNNGFLRFQDLTITGTSGSGIRNGILVAANNVDVIGCHIYNICQFLTDGTSWLGGAGIDFSGPDRSNILIDRNVIHDVGLRSSTQQLVHGIYCGVHGSNFQIVNNVIYECEDFGVHPYDPTETSGIQIINNTVVSCGRGILQGPSGTTRNNIVYKCSGSAYDIRGSGNTGSNNYYSSSGSPTGTNVGWTSISSPGFVNGSTTSTPDFHLATGSVLINAGSSTGAPTTDGDGYTRPSGASYDVGAYEFGAAPGTSTGTEVYRPVAILWPDDGINPWPYGAEYDFWELGGPDRTAAQAFMHFPSLDGSDSQRQFTKDAINSNDFHNYAIEWSPDSLVGYIDGVEWFRTSGGATAARRNIQEAPGPMHLTLQFDPTSATGLQPGKMEVDWIRVYPLTPIDDGTTPTPGGGGGTSIGTYPTFNATGTPVSASDGTSSFSVGAPAGVKPGHFQICIIQCATSAETITTVPADWQLLDEKTITTVTGGDSGDTSAAWVYYNTTGDSAARTWAKSGTRGFHAVRMSWNGFSGLGQHFVRASSSTLTPYGIPVTPSTDKAAVIAVLCSDRLNTTSGPITVPTGWTQRYNSGPTINGDEFESIAVGEIQVDNRAVTGANVPTGTGLGTSNFNLTVADSCQVFTFVIEGPVSTGTAYSGSTNLVAQHRLLINLNLPPLGTLFLTALPSLLVRPLFKGGVAFWIIPTLNPSSSVFPKGALIITPTLTFITRQTGVAGLLLQALAVLRAGALPYRRPVLRTEYQYPPLDHPFRLIAQRILDGEIIEWELPVGEDFEYVEQLSGPVVMHGSFPVEMIQVQELGLDGYAYWLHVEINQEIRASAILLPPQYQESGMTFSAEGVTAAPHYTIYDGVFSQIQVDPLSVVRTLWNYVQSQPQSDYGVVLSQNSSPVRIGEPATTQQFNDRTKAAQEIARRMDSGESIFEDWTWTDSPPEVGAYNDELIRLWEAAGRPTDQKGWLEDFASGHPASEAKPYEILWWEATNVGQEIDTLSDQTPFDYLERHTWNVDRTDVLHFVDLGYPRLGVTRSELLFNEENIVEVVPVQEPEDSYASAVLVIGAGDGKDTIRGYAAQSYGDRVRKEITITDKTIQTKERANARALSELAFRRGRAFEASEIVINAYHPNAPIGSYRVGDDIQVQLEIPWLMEIHIAWYRITSISNKPSSDKVRLGIARSDTLLDTSDIWIEPDDYVPFAPPPPVGPVSWNGNVFLLVLPNLSVIPPVPVPTASSVLIVNANFSASGVAFGGSFAFISFYANYSLTLGDKQTLIATAPLAVSPSLVASGIATGVGFSTVTMNISSALITNVSAIGATVNLNALPVLNPTATGAFASTATLSATTSLTTGATQIRPGAISLSVSAGLSANGTISSQTTVTQLGNTTNGTGSSSSSANKTVVSKATAFVDGTVTDGHARLWVDSGTASVQMVVYSDNAGNPDALLGLSNSVTISNTTETLIDFVFSGVQQAGITTGDDYWIGFTWPDPGLNNITWSRGTTASQAQQNALNAAGSFGTPGTTLSGPIDAYVDVSSTTGGGGGGTTPPAFGAVGTNFDATSGQVNRTFAYPAGVSAGDILIVHWYEEGTATTVTPPSGWVEIGTGTASTGSVHRHRLFWKRAVGGESGSVAFSHSSLYCGGYMSRWTGCIATGTPFETQGGSANAGSSSSSTSAPAVSDITDGPNRLLVYCAMSFSGGTWTPPSGFTERNDTNTESGSIASKVQATAGATGSINGVVSSAAFTSSRLLALIPV